MGAKGVVPTAKLPSGFLSNLLLLLWVSRLERVGSPAVAPLVREEKKAGVRESSPAVVRSSTREGERRGEVVFVRGKRRRRVIVHAAGRL